MSLRRTSETSADGLAAKSLLCNLLANPPLHLKRRLDLGSVAGFWDLRFSEFCDGCGSRSSYRQLSVPEG
jgi:hypothetical protein